jgi:hypothetical protein
MLLGSAGDRHALEDTYDEWMLLFEKGLKNMRAAGIEPIRVDVDINELLAWCKEKGFKNTGEYPQNLLRSFVGRVEVGRLNNF